jgi:WD40 repeat protein
MIASVLIDKHKIDPTKPPENAMKRLFVCLFLCFSVVLFFNPSVCFAANPFFYFNQRIHSELDWREIHTEHFRIIYHQRLEKVAGKAAQVAEASYQPVCSNLDHFPEEKIPLYITDQDDIANGFTVADWFIAVWVHVNSYLEWTTGTDKWLRKVISHELVHYVHFDAIRSSLGFLGFGLSNTPRWFIEGLAQYYSETWNVKRGDALLRTAVINDDLTTQSRPWPDNGRLVYALGNSRVRFLASEYGDSSIVRILQERDKFLFLETYSFAKNFSKITPPSEFEHDWRRHVNVYFNTLYGQKEQYDEFSRSIDLPVKYISAFTVSPDSQWLALVGQVNYLEPLQKLVLIRNDSTRQQRTLVHGGVGAQIAFSPDSRHIVYDRLTRGEFGSIRRELFVTDLEGNSRHLTHDHTAMYPDWSPNGEEILYVSESDGSANLVRYAWPDGPAQVMTGFTGDIQLMTPRWSPDGESIVAVLSEPTGLRNLIRFLNDGSWHHVTADSFDNRLPVWSPDGESIVFTSFRSGIANLYRKSLTTNDSLTLMTDTAMGVSSMAWTGDSLWAVLKDRREFDTLIKMDASRQTSLNPVRVDSQFSAWTHKRPPHGLPPFDSEEMPTVAYKGPFTYQSLKNVEHLYTLPLPFAVEDHAGLFVSSLFMEPLGKHVWSGAGFLDVQKLSNSRGMVLLQDNRYLSLTALLYALPQNVQIYEGKTLIEEQFGATLQVHFPIPFGDALFTSHEIGLGVSWAQHEPLEPERFERQPVSRRIGSFSLEYTRVTVRPNRMATIHPQHAHGVKLRLKSANTLLGEQRFDKGTLDAFWLRNLLAQHVLYAYARLQTVSGDLLPQDFVGFDKYDQPDFGYGLVFSDRLRLRGIREYQFGDRLLFGSLEYRIPFVRDLGWIVAGVRFKSVILAPFMDVGKTWDSRFSSFNKQPWQKTYGVEFKNNVNLSGFEFAHQFGAVWKWGEYDEPSWYYRIRAVMPF